MPKLEYQDKTFWVIFKHCAAVSNPLLTFLHTKMLRESEKMRLFEMFKTMLNCSSSANIVKLSKNRNLLDEYDYEARASSEPKAFTYRLTYSRTRKTLEQDSILVQLVMQTHLT